MTARHQYSRLLILPFFVIFILFASSLSASEIPDANSINEISHEAKLSWEAFLKNSFRFRMAYECSGDFISENDRQELRQICYMSANELRIIEQAQKSLQKQIEDYEGDDWEKKYGTTELWRNITYQSQTTSLYICSINFYRAITYTGQEKQQLLKINLEELNGLQQESKNIYLDFLQARILEALGQANQKEKLLKELLRGEYKDDAQLTLVLAFLQRHQKQYSEFEKTLELYPQVRAFAGELILYEIRNRLKIGEPVNQIAEQLSPVEARLVAMQTIKIEASDDSQLLEAMISRQELRLPEVLFAAAFSENPSPKTVELLIEASRLQQKKKSKSFTLTASDIAQHAARMAYNLYASNTNNCEFAMEAFNNYRQISSKTMTEELEYAYALLLCGCSDSRQGQKILQKIADSESKYNGKAKLWFWAKEIQANRHNKDPNQNLLILKQFSKSLDETDGCQFAEEGLNLIEDVIGKIENFEAKADYDIILRDCRKVTEILTKCRNESSEKWLLAEIYVLSEDVNESGFFMIEELLEESGRRDEPDFLRCQARFLQKKREFEKAAGVWISLSQSVNRESYDWWRAKYYELYCFFSCKIVSKKDIGHVINVLQGSYGDIPSPWAEKFDDLKQRCMGKG